MISSGSTRRSWVSRAWTPGTITILVAGCYHRAFQVSRDAPGSRSDTHSLACYLPFVRGHCGHSIGDGQSSKIHQILIARVGEQIDDALGRLPSHPGPERRGGDDYGGGAGVLQHRDGAPGR